MLKEPIKIFSSSIITDGDLTENNSLYNACRRELIHDLVAFLNREGYFNITIEEDELGNKKMTAEIHVSKPTQWEPNYETFD